MKKILLLFLALPFFGSAQTTNPSYPEVVTEFFRSYTYENPMDPVEGISFAKKKQGWTVMVIDRMSEKQKAEYLFWSAKEKKYLPLKFGEPGNDHKEKAETYVSEHAFDIYSYYRNIYYGYNGWQNDVIAEFGNGDITRYSDTLIESLGRAYASIADRFLYYYHGNTARPVSATEQNPGKLDMPSRQRIDSVNYYIRKSIESFKTLFEKNPRYQTLVGNSGSKWFNEQMHGYQQMMMAGYPDLAKEYIAMVIPDDAIRKQAKNYLTALPQNSILFTYGDNDTYPLWWIQAAENYRTDVTVINNSLLGLPVYIHGLKKNLEFSSTEKFYGDSSFLYWPYREEGRKSMTVSELLQYVQTKKNLFSSDVRFGNTYSFPAKTFTISIDTGRFRKLAPYGRFTTKMQLELKEGYLLNNEVIILDILNSNFHKRPIYFTAPERLFEGYLLNEGFVYRLLPLDRTKEAVNNTISKKIMLSFVKEKLNQLPSNDSTSKINFSGFENQVYPLYASIATWYIKNKKPNEAKMLINELLAVYKNNPVFSYNLSDIWLALLEAGDLSALAHLEAYAKKTASLYLNTEPENGYLSKAYAAFYLDNLIEKLKQLNITNGKINAIRERL